MRGNTTIWHFPLFISKVILNSIKSKLEIGKLKYSLYHLRNFEIINIIILGEKIIFYTSNRT